MDDSTPVELPINEETIRTHILDEAAARKEQSTINHEMAIFKAETEGTLATLATKDDIKEVLKFMREIKVGFGVFQFSFDNAGKIGAFLLLVAGVFMFFKFGLAAAAAFFLGTTKY